MFEAGLGDLERIQGLRGFGGARKHLAAEFQKGLCRQGDMDDLVGQQLGVPAS